MPIVATIVCKGAARNVNYELRQPSTEPKASIWDQGQTIYPSDLRAPDDRRQPRLGRRSKIKRALGPLGGLAALLAKVATKLKAILILLPKVKLFATSATMLVSIAAYTLLWGLRFAVGFVVLLFVHELGHVWQLRREGVKASAPMFVPFLGAFIAAKEFGKDAAAEARVGLAGPVLGSLASLVPLALFAVTGNELFKALAFVGFFLNLFNLLPVLPLDGGRAMAAVSPWMWVAGFAALVALAIVFPNPIVVLILLLGGLETWRRFRQRNLPQAQAFHRVKPLTRAAIACVYIGLAVGLALGMHATFLPRGIGSG